MKRDHAMPVRSLLATVAAIVYAVVVLMAAPAQAQDGWVGLFDGKSFDGWKVGKNASSFRIENDAIVANGPVAHLFYVGPVQGHCFKNFHFKAEVMTTPGSNSGLYFHTTYQEAGWPRVGYEVQVNNSHTDPKRTGGLYGIKDVFEAPAKDNEWFTEEIIVQGKRIITKVNGKVLVDYVEPADVTGQRRLSQGTFAIQAHDPKSKVFIRKIMVKPLPAH